MKEQKNCDLCWIHLSNIQAYLHLGAHPLENKIGQNITLCLSIQIPFGGTNDKLENTLDYGSVIHAVKEFLKQMGSIQLLEFLAEKILTYVGQAFTSIRKAKVTIQKGYLPISHFHGTAVIEAERVYV